MNKAKTRVYRDTTEPNWNEVGMDSSSWDLSAMLGLVYPLEAEHLQMKRLFGLQSVLHELDPSHMRSTPESTVCRVPVISSGLLPFVGDFNLGDSLMK